MTKYRCCCGTTLVEVLVALIIVTTGMLGMASLQTSALRSQHNAQLRTQAVLLANDIIERMRANVQGVNAGSYTGEAGQFNESCLRPTGCGFQSLARHDIAEWQAELAAKLPSGTGIICHDATPNDGMPGASACDGAGDLLIVKIWWDARREGTASERLVIPVRF